VLSCGIGPGNGIGGWAGGNSAGNRDVGKSELGEVGAVVMEGAATAAGVLGAARMLAGWVGRAAVGCSTAGEWLRVTPILLTPTATAGVYLIVDPAAGTAWLVAGVCSAGMEAVRR
jgi:hypothetical protein